ncbi:NTP transferase domain-containing protein [Nitrososphaera sp.]|uniref:NTP transferase domain-containing protein n=1 Tax=Nitrososphaera sp. TaxID=1971748 RepID=UPI00317D1CE1
MIAAVMCGGAGSRLGAGEKPMLELAGKRYVERVIGALVKSGRFEKVVAAVSPKTPLTRKLLAAKGVEIIDTPGAGYPQDLSLLLAKLVPEKVLVVPADVPLLTPAVVRDVLDLLEKESGPAVSLAAEKSFVEKLGLTPSVLVGNLCHSGITLFDSQVSGPVEERYVVMNRAETAVNVNTKREKELAESLVKRGDDFAKYPGL